MQKTFTYAAALLISACTAPVKTDIHSSHSVAAATSSSRDDFKKLVSFSGPNAARDLGDRVFIRAWKHDAQSQTFYQIYIADYYDGPWRFYTETYDSDGTRLKTTVISRDTGTCSKYGCSHIEHLGVDVTKSYLESKAETGVSFKISGKAGEEVFFLPNEYIKGFLNATSR